MKITNDRLDEMFLKAGVSREHLHNALLKWGTDGLKGSTMKSEWSEDNPTRNHCYVVSEMVYHYLAPKYTKPYILDSIEGENAVHWFLLYPDYSIVDLTCDQFPNYSLVDYTKGKRCNFLTSSNNGGISERAVTLWELYNLEIGNQSFTKLPQKNLGNYLEMWW